MVPIAAFAGLIYKLIFFGIINQLLKQAITNTFGIKLTIDASTIINNVLMGILLLAVFIYVIMAVAIILSGVTTWLMMRSLRIGHAVATSTISSIILIVLWYLFIKTDVTKNINITLLSVVSFVITYEVVLAILMLKNKNIQ